MLLILLFIGSPAIASGLRILAVFPFPQKSHQIVFNALIKELLVKGHDVLVYSSQRINIQAFNYTHIYTSYPTEEEFDELSTFDAYKGSFDYVPIISPVRLQKSKINLTEGTLRQPQIKALIESNETFDVLLLETMFAQEAFLGFSYRFNAPVVTLSSFGSYSLMDSVMGNPNPLAYLPSNQLPFNSNLSYFQRFRNMMIFISEQFYSYYIHIPHQEEVMKKHFGATKDSQLPPLIDMLTNMPVVLLNTQPEVTHVRAFLPNMINVGGLHIPKYGKPLPEEIQEFMDGAKLGVIYFSLGSSFKSSSMPQYIKDAFIGAFESIPQRVLWKIDEDPSDIPSNVKVLKWAPQTDILRHPKCTAFITHGGLLSLLEATHFGVPLIGIPLFAEQSWNVAKMLEAQIGLKIKVKDITENTVASALAEIHLNTIYKKNIMKLSALMKDRLAQSPLDTAVHWVEYVAKHQGAPQLHSPARNMSSFLLFHLDVIFTFALAFVVTSKLQLIIISVMSKIMRRL